MSRLMSETAFRERMAFIGIDLPLYRPKPWICMHGIDVESVPVGQDPCPACSAHLAETLAIARHRNAVAALHREHEARHREDEPR